MHGLERLNPIAVTIYFLLVSSRIMLSMDPVLLCCSLIGALLLHVVLCGFSQKRMHLYSLALFAVMAIINPLFNHNGATVLFVMNNNPVTLEALLYGVAAAGMILSVIYWFRSFSQIMTSDKLLYVFGGISPKLALLLSMTLRYVPLFSMQAKKISQSQKALGLYKEDNIIDGFRGGLRIFSVMVTWTLENGIITADSMTARGYGTGKRSRYSLFRWQKEDVLLTLLSVLLCGISFAFDSGFAFYPVVQSLDFSHGMAAGYLAYGLLSLLPVIIEGKEALKWRILTSRM